MWGCEKLVKFSIPSWQTASLSSQIPKKRQNNKRRNKAVSVLRVEREEYQKVKKRNKLEVFKNIFSKDIKQMTLYW
jgi:hypothetical protein